MSRAVSLAPRLIAAACLLFAGCSAQPRVKVRVAADSSFRTRAGWRNVVEKRLAAVSRIYEEDFWLRWKLVNAVEWEAGDVQVPIEKLRRSMRANVPRGRDEILLGLISRPIHDERQASVVPWSDALIVIDSPALSEEVNTLRLAHELAHLFGAQHPADGTPMVQSTAGAVTFDPTAAEAIRRARSFDFSRGLAGLDSTRRSQLLGFIAAQLPPNVPSERSLATAQLAVLLESDGQTEAALHQAQDAVNSVPDSGWAQLVAGRLLLELDRTAEALPHLAQAVQTEPGMAEAHEQLGMALIRSGRVQEAKQEWARAIQLAPERPEPHFQLGLLLADELGGRDVGIALLTRAVTLRPNDPRAAAALKITFTTRAALEADEQHERSLAERFPAQPSAHFSLGVALLRQGKFQDAVHELRRAAELRPGFGEAHANLATADFCLGDIAEARRQLQLSLKFGAHPPEPLVAALRE